MERNILVVDDDKCLYDIISRILIKPEVGKNNLKFFYAESLEKAKNILSNENIDLVYTDYAIKGFSETGEDVINWINKNKLKAKVVVTTAITDSSLYQKLKDKGASQIMRKPFNQKTLMNSYKTNIEEV